MPITRYSQELNGLTNTEWKDLGLPPTASCYHTRNVQLSNLYSTTNNTAESSVTPPTVLSPPASQRLPGSVFLSPPPRSQLPVINDESIDDILFLTC